MNRQTARGVALLALTPALWFVVADVTARAFDGPVQGLVSLAGGGLVGLFVTIPGMVFVMEGRQR